MCCLCSKVDILGLLSVVLLCHHTIIYPELLFTTINRMYPDLTTFLLMSYWCVIPWILLTPRGVTLLFIKTLPLWEHFTSGTSWKIQLLIDDTHLVWSTHIFFSHWSCKHCVSISLYSEERYCQPARMFLVLRFIFLWNYNQITAT